MDIINQAIIVLAFDDIETYGLQDSMEHAVLGDCRNRWYDKGYTAIISKTGLIGSTHDHIHLDAYIAREIMKL